MIMFQLEYNRNHSSKIIISNLVMYQFQLNRAVQNYGINIVLFTSIVATSTRT